VSWAADQGHEAVVRLLLEKDAELDSKSSDGQTPVSWAMERGYDAVVRHAAIKQHLYFSPHEDFTINYTLEVVLLPAIFAQPRYYGVLIA
jgi:Ankyrin repeats (many copies)